MCHAATLPSLTDSTVVSATPATSPPQNTPGSDVDMLVWSTTGVPQNCSDVGESLAENDEDSLGAASKSRSGAIKGRVPGSQDNDPAMENALSTDHDSQIICGQTPASLNSHSKVLHQGLVVVSLPMFLLVLRRLARDTIRKLRRFRVQDQEILKADLDVRCMMAQRPLFRHFASLSNNIQASNQSKRKGFDQSLNNPRSSLFTRGTNGAEKLCASMQLDPGSTTHALRKQRAEEERRVKAAAEAEESKAWGMDEQFEKMLAAKLAAAEIANMKRANARAIEEEIEVLSRLMEIVRSRDLEPDEKKLINELLQAPDAYDDNDHASDNKR
ncbi:unnamed protein product [Notodromas monacha]|uniref:Uncharacterized protein n=1 Tax=Notodromas monacha TaxID=399045 RepID=A0A7R9BUX1_9CRUS|nr:unnamed protein product [Notodromas monacha]CAG0921160.1 unnamed protein product [Notodromas monacha]